MARQIGTRRKMVFFTGAGFSLGFGWLWFTPLQEMVLPHFLWGQAFSPSGAGLFLLLLCLGFFAASLLFLFFMQREKPANEKGTNLFSPYGKTAQIIHLSALILMAAGFFIPERFYLSEYFAVFCIAFCAVLMGLYWMTAIFSLGVCGAPMALGLACLAAIILLPILENVPAKIFPLVPLVFILLAWFAALGAGHIAAQGRLLAEIERKKALEEKRPRGRPALRSQEREAEADRVSFPSRFPLVIGLVFFLMGLGQAGGRYDRMISLQGMEISGWLVLFFYMAGVFLILFPALGLREKQKEKFFKLLWILLLVLFVQGGILLLSPKISPFFFPLGEGVLETLIFVLAAGLSSFPYFSWKRTGFYAAVFLLAAVFFTNAGSWVADMLWKIFPPGSGEGEGAARWIGGFILFPAGVFLLFFAWRHYQEKHAVFPDTNSKAMEKFLTLLTPRELEIAGLVGKRLSNREIAENLYVSEATVRFHLKNIYQKTGLTDRSSLQDLGGEK